MPINGGKTKTFEELLESNLKNYEIAPKYNEEPHDRKTFLKKGSKKRTLPNLQGTKKYNYYVDNFGDQATNKEDRPGSSAVSDT
jgi:hypothetical protein